MNIQKDGHVQRERHTNTTTDGQRERWTDRKMDKFRQKDREKVG